MTTTNRQKTEGTFLPFRGGGLTHACAGTIIRPNCVFVLAFSFIFLSVLSAIFLCLHAVNKRHIAVTANEHVVV